MPPGAVNQAQVLRGEGVTVTRSNMGELMVDFAEYGVSICIRFFIR